MSTPEGKSVATKVTIQAQIREKLPEEVKKLPEGFEKGMLHIFRIKTFDLANMELLGSWDKQDPYIKVKFGQDYERKTMYLNNGGGMDVIVLLLWK